MLLRRDGELFNEIPQSHEFVEIREEMKGASIGRRYAVEIWTNSPGKEGAKFLAEEIFDTYPSEDQLYWCFNKYGDCVLRVKEECYLIYPKYSTFDPDKVKINA